MKSTYSVIFFFLSCLISNISASQPQKAVINVPIADLVGQQITTMRPNESAHVAYNSIALCGKTNSTYACPRLHQALYNDVVEVIKTTEDEAYIRIPQTYYLTPSSSTPQSHYWTLKKNITLLDELTQYAISLNHVPEPIDFSDTSGQALNHSNVITLTEPHYDGALHITFSVGTRFIKIPSISKKRNSTIEVFAVNYQTHKEHHIKIPCYKCMTAQPTKTYDERITDYIALLKKWAHTKQGCIPYTWGGTSFTHTTPGTFKEVMHKTTHSDYSAYEYDKDNCSPKSGFDCSGVIARATQICGIPYFCKNTTTISQLLKPIAQDQMVTAGDLILIKGHVMAISDITKNLLIEARSYAHGYGRLHEIPLNQMFEGIETYKDLMDAYFNKTIIKLKDKEGKVRGTFANLQLFSMASVIK